MAWVHQLALEWLAPLAVWFLVNGVDDLFIDLIRIGSWLRERRRPAWRPASLDREPRAAVLIPCWREADVIEQMLDRNITALQYENYDVWVGLYPNDLESIERVRRCAKRHPRVRFAIGPRPGPTTKADCLNQVIDGVLTHEEMTGDYYELFLQHDAEDLMDPLELDQAARWSRHFDMVQIPVFPLPTPVGELTHGVYCDDFADVHQRELPVRWRLGGFIPSAGVGTALRREAVDQLRISYGRQVFDPSSLTEDYFLGLRLHELGFSQAFALEPGPGGETIASRAYFPRSAPAAIRQRTRWTIGNVLQSWERFGWRPSQAYWLWRDRKGLLNSPVALFANLLFGWGCLDWALASAAGRPWALGASIGALPWTSGALAAATAFLVWRQAVRMWWSSRLYGGRFAAAAPVRAVWANAINVAAGARALAIFAAAKVRRRPLLWAKTQHAYPASVTPAGSSGFRLHAAAATLVTLQQAAALDVVPLRLENKTLVLACRRPPSLGAERRARKLLRWNSLRLVQVSARDFANLRSAHRTLAEDPPIAAASAGD